MDTNPEQLQQKPAEYPADYNPCLNGIGGWLILIIIGRILSVILGIKDIADSSAAYGFSPVFDTLLTVGIILDIVFSITASVVILILIFSRNILFRLLFVIQVVVMFIFNLIVIIYVNSLGYNFGSGMLIGSIIGGVIWILYVYRSARVKNTYIYPKLYK